MLIIKRNNNNLMNLFDDFVFKPVLKNESRLMRTDIEEDDVKYTFNIEIPGFNKEDIKLSFESGYLTVEATKQENGENKEEVKYLRRERYLGNFSRSYYLGDIDDNSINASYNNGILTISVSKQKPVENKKYIAIE